MNGAGADVLALLLPEADEPSRERARKVTTFLRLVANDASAQRATSVQLVLDTARGELERCTRERLLGALEDLLVHHLEAARSAESFLSLPAARSGTQSAWSVLEEERRDYPWLAAVPVPGETTLDVAGRLLACARRLGLDREQAAMWNARRTALIEGPRAAESAFRALLSKPGSASAGRTTAAALAGVVECLLDRGSVRRAAAFLAEHREAAKACAHLERLSAWVAVLLEVPSAAGHRPPASRVPAPLAALRACERAWLEPLAGRAARGPARRFSARAGRGEVGAAALAVFALDRAGLARLLESDCSPGHRSRVAAWCAEREDALRSSHELEHAALVGAQPVVAHARPEAPLHGVLCPASVRAAAVVPVLDERGEGLGWLRLEFEHHLVPSTASLRALARSWRETCRGVPSPESVPAAAAGPALREFDSRCEDARRDVLVALVAALGIKTAQRRWWGVLPGSDGPVLIDESGGALSDWRNRPGGGQALRRAMQTGGRVRFDEPDAALALCADAASGVVLPLRHGVELVAALVVESTRRRDLVGLAAAFDRETHPWAAELRVAGFRAWHARHFAVDPTFEVGVSKTLALAEVLFAAARSGAPVALCGARGTGKRILARWLHFESQRAQGPLLSHACRAGSSPAEEAELFGAAGAGPGRLARARGGSLVLEDVEGLSAQAQTRLAACLAEAAGAESARLVVTSTRPLAEGALCATLTRRLERLELFVPTLAERRDELPGLVLRLARRFARELGRARPELSDEVLAALWRQPWPGNVRELENVVYKLVLFASSGLIGMDDLYAVARRFRFDLLARSSSRDPDLDLVEAALRATRTQRGTDNKTRAALYLGWDPDTLARVRAEARAGSTQDPAL